MHIDALLNLISGDNDRTEFDDLKITSDWSQGRTVYGGLIAGLLFTATRQQVNKERKLLSMSCNFIGPVLVDTAFSIETQQLRVGKSVSQVMVTLKQEGRVCTIGLFSFGMSRNSKINVPNKEVHAMPFPKRVKFIPMIPKVVPKFLQHFEFSLHDGKFPFSASSASHLHGWMRFKKAPYDFTKAHLIASIDAWPPTVLQMLRLPASASTMNWNVQFIQPSVAIEPHEWLGYKVQTRHAADGYCHTASNIWNAKEELVAISHQTVAVFA